MAINELIFRCIEKPDNYWYLAPTYKQVKLIAWELLKRFTPLEIRAKQPNESELSMRLSGGGEIRLIGAENPENLRGVGLRGCVLDEYPLMRREVWQTIIRPMLSEKRGWAWFIGTPKGKQNQLYEAYIKDPLCHDPNYLTIDGERIAPDPDYKSYKFRTLDSPFIPKEEIEKARIELAPQYFRQEYEASFEEFVGKIYKEYADRHNIDIHIKNWWRFYVGIDTGRWTAISFVAVDDKDIAYCFDEIYDFDGVVRDIANKIKYKCAEYNIKPIFIIDSASQVKREYESAGVYCNDSEKDIENSIEHIRNRFKTDRLYFDKNKCINHILQHNSYVWDDKLGANKRPVPVKENDHAVNSLQYVLNFTGISKVNETPDQKEYKKSIEYLTIKRDRNR